MRFDAAAFACKTGKAGKEAVPIAGMGLAAQGGKPAVAGIAGSRVRPAFKPGRRDSIEAGTYRVRPLPAYFRCALTSLVSSNIVT